MKVSYKAGIIFLFLSVSIILVALVDPVIQRGLESQRTLSMETPISLYFASLIVFLIGVFFIILGYLKPSSYKYQYRESYSEKFYSLETDYRELEMNRALSDVEKEEIKKEIYNSKFSELKSELEIKSSDNLKGNDPFRMLRESFSSIKDRLKNEITNLMNRGNINLGAGVIITIIAVVALWFSLTDFYDGMSKSNYKDTTEMLIAILPRLSLVLLIEIFAYFFLRLYKIGLTDIKYYQNELTNIELKLISLETAHITTNDEALKEALHILAQTERNFVLKKGETTVELEKAKSESESMKTIINAVPSLFKQKGR